MKHLHVKHCAKCPFMIRGGSLHEGASGTPMYRVVSMFCTAVGNSLIVDSSKKPDFCPLPLTVHRE